MKTKSLTLKTLGIITTLILMIFLVNLFDNSRKNNLLELTKEKNLQINHINELYEAIEIVNATDLPKLLLQYDTLMYDSITTNSTKSNKEIEEVVLDSTIFYARKEHLEKINFLYLSLKKERKLFEERTKFISPEYSESIKEKKLLLDESFNRFRDLANEYLREFNSSKTVDHLDFLLISWIDPQLIIKRGKLYLTSEELSYEINAIRLTADTLFNMLYRDELDVLLTPESRNNKLLALKMYAELNIEISNILVRANREDDRNWFLRKVNPTGWISKKRISTLQKLVKQFDELLFKEKNLTLEERRIVNNFHLMSSSFGNSEIEINR